MAASSENTSVGDSVPKINDDLAVGSDLEFQRRWWKFENVTWWLFAVIVLMDILGCFGRGPLANAKVQTPDGTMKIKYERIERLSTPSLITIEFGGSAIKDEKLQLLVSESLVKRLGNQRVVPQPAVSRLGDSKIMYTFPANRLPASVQFSLEPSEVGISHLTLQVPGADEAKLTIFVMP